MAEKEAGRHDQARAPHLLEGHPDLLAGRSEAHVHRLLGFAARQSCRFLRMLDDELPGGRIRGP